jgi:hypothetical protein
VTPVLAAASWGNAESVRAKIEAASARVNLLFVEVLLFDSAPQSACALS